MDFRRVLLGTGMGCKHSGSVADACLLALAESEMGDARFRESLGLQLYCRYRDDILAIVRAPQFCPMLTNHLSATSASIYTIDLESFSQVGSTMLDLFV